MDLFSVVRLAKPTQVTVGVRLLRDGEEPVLQAAAGRTMVLAPEEGSADTPPVEAEPIRSFPSLTPQVPVVELSETDSTESAEAPKSENEPESASQGTKRKQAGEDAGIGTSKRRRALVSDEQSSSEEDASRFLHVDDTTSPK